MNAARSAELAGRAALVAIVGMALLRTTTAFAPELVFDIDPALAGGAQPALGPAGSLLVDVVLLLGAALALAGERLAGRTVSGRMLLLALLPVPVLLRHGWSSADDLVHGSAWIAAVAGAVGLAHLCREDRTRRLALAMLLAAVAPLAVRGVWQITVEHDATVRLYMRTKEAFLAARGWSPDSPQARIYEERLRQPEATGWFALANVYSSLMVAMALCWAGASLAAVRRRLPGGWSGLAAIMALVAIGLVAFNGSKGAVGALLFGGTFILLGAWRPKLLFGPGRWALVLLPLVGLAAIVARGMLPEGLGAERSLLFRWQYLVGAGGVISDHWLLGAGPEGFRDAYLLVRLPRAPEEIGSAHSVMVDWLAAMGVAALAWIGLVAWMLVRLVGRCAHEPPTQHARAAGLEPAADGASLPRREIVVPLLALAIGFAPSLLIEGAIFTPADLVLRGVGVVGWLVLAIFLDVLLGRCAEQRRIIEWTLAVAMAALLLHAQIEMTLWMPGSALFAMTLLGAAATAPARGVGWAARAGAGVLALGAVALAFLGWLPAHRQQSLLIDAAMPLQTWSTVRSEQPMPADAPRLEASAREAAAAGLRTAWEAWPINTAPAARSIEQVLIAAVLTEGDERARLLCQAGLWSDDLLGREGSGRAVRAAAMVAEAQAEGGHDPAGWQAAYDAWQQVAERDPQSMVPALRAAQAAERAGMSAAAAAALERALQIDGNLVLDPRKQLTREQRREIERRVERLRGDARHQGIEAPRHQGS